MPRRAGWLVVALLAVFAVRVIDHSARICPTYDEPAHLAAGYSYLKWWDFRLNPEHPPLVKVLAALPLLALDPWPESLEPGDADAPPGPGSMSWRRVQALWPRAVEVPAAQWPIAHELLYGVRDEALRRLGARASMLIDPRLRVEPTDYLNDADRLMFWARLPILGFGLMLCLLVFGWARDLFGWRGGLLALTVGCFDPSLLAHAGLVTTDAAAAALVFGSVYGLWRWQHDRRWQSAALAIVCFALAFTAKFSAVLLVPPVIGLSLAAAASSWRRGDRSRASGVILMTAGAALAAYLAVWGSFGFRYAAVVEGPGPSRLPVEETLRQVVEKESRFVPEVRNREFLGVVDRTLAWAHRHRLLPESYLMGLARARWESRARPAFLRGELSERGFRNFFLWTTLLKTPLIVLLAIALALALVARRLGRLDALHLLGPPLFFLAAAIGSHLNIGHRHILPVFPFLWVLCGGLAHWLGRPGVGRRKLGLAGAMLVIAAGSSVVFAPPWRPVVTLDYSLEYFNELAGGPRNGYRSLVDSNLDWGQGLARLSSWLESREVEEPINLCYFGNADPRFYRIRHVKMPGGYVPSPPLGDLARFEDAVRPGYLAISATHYQGVWFTPELRRRWRTFLADAELVDVVGYSILIFRLGESPSADAR